MTAATDDRNSIFIGITALGARGSGKRHNHVFLIRNAVYR